LALQSVPAPQLPQLWPHTGSGPHTRLPQLGVQAVSHWPLALQVPLLHTPQLWPHTGSGPHTRLPQFGMQPSSHLSNPGARHSWLSGQVFGQVPPQPSDPPHSPWQVFTQSSPPHPESKRVIPTIAIKNATSVRFMIFLLSIRFRSA
jgi:hypothetical protein